MGKLAERCSEIARRCGDLSPVAPAVRDILWRGNAAALLAGKTPYGEAVAPLMPSTLRRRKGTGPPRVPSRTQSRMVAGYVVNVEAGPARLRFTGSWPAHPWVQYHVTGTRYMAARNPMGFRAEDLDEIRGLLGPYVMGWRKYLPSGAGLADTFRAAFGLGRRG